MAGAMRSIKTVSGSLTADTDVIPAVPGRCIKVFSYILVSVGTNLDRITFRSGGAGGLEIWRDLAQAAASAPTRVSMVIPPDAWLFATRAGEQLTIDVDQTDLVHYAIGYFADDTF